MRFYILFEYSSPVTRNNFEEVTPPLRNNPVAFLCPLNTLSAEKLLRTKTQGLSLVHVISKQNPLQLREHLTEKMMDQLVRKKSTDK